MSLLSKYIRKLKKHLRNKALPKLKELWEKNELGIFEIVGRIAKDGILAGKTPAQIAETLFVEISRRVPDLESLWRERKAAIVETAADIIASGLVLDMTPAEIAKAAFIKIKEILFPD